MGRQARYINIILGLWMIVSAFLWPHSSSQFTNGWVVGLLSAFAAIIALSAPGARYVNTVLGAWLFVSAWALPRMMVGTAWNDVLVGIAMFVVSLIPSQAQRFGIHHRTPIAH
jgi:hypothetical protein